VRITALLEQRQPVAQEIVLWIDFGAKQFKTLQHFKNGGKN